MSYIFFFIFFFFKAEDGIRVRDVTGVQTCALPIRLTFGARSFLMTGDIERRAERELVTSGDAIKSDFVKVAHHGSRTSSTQEFVDAVHPEYAVISVGRNSPYGHPHADVVERWAAAGAHVLTTGKSGTVTVSTDGGDLKISTYLP